MKNKGHFRWCKYKHHWIYSVKGDWCVGYGKTQEEAYDHWRSSEK